MITRPHFLHLDYLVEIIDQLLFNKRDLKVYEYSQLLAWIYVNAV